MPPKPFRQTLRRLIPFPRRKTWRKWFPAYETRQLVWLMQHYDIQCVLDIGANQGQFVEKIRSAKWQGSILSFEPQAKEHALLIRKSEKDAHWNIAERIALGDAEGTVTMNRFSDSSVASILHPTEQLQRSMASAGTEQVPLKRLDQIVTAHTILPGHTLLKLDVQGFEPQVLRGATRLLPHVSAIFIEVSLLPMYDGDTHYLDMLDYLHNIGFHAVHISPVLNRKRFGNTGQLDVFLVRQPPAILPRHSLLAA